jgi:outer membrane receptor protein involved in Fe transport
VLRSRTAAFALSAFLLPLFAQTASVTGRITDPSGAVIPDVPVVLVNEATSVEFKGLSNAEGYFQIPSIPPGKFRINIEKEGFKSVKVSGIELIVGQVARLDYVLEVGAVADSVEVSGRAVLLDSETSSLGQVVGSRQIAELPLLGRNAYSLAALVPGVRASIGMNDLPVDQISTVSASINGSRSAQNEFLLDGAPNTAGAQNQPVINQNVDSVQEFKVETNTFSAEYGRTAGGVFNVVTKSGANDLTFTAYEFLRNNSLNANDFFANRAGRKIAPFRFNQFGGVIGGPVVIPHVYNGKNRTFFFGSAELVRFSQGMTWTASVPTAEQLLGNFSNSKNSAGQAITIFDPATTASNGAGGYLRTAFPGNQIPSSRFDPVAAKILKYWPSPNATGSTNYVRTDSNTIEKDTWSMRMDHNFTEKNRFFGRYSYDLTPWTRAPIYGADNVASPTFGAQVFTRYNAVLEDTHVVSPSMVATVRGSWARLSNFRHSYGYGFDMTSLGFSPELVKQMPFGTFPNVNVTGLSTSSSVGNVGGGGALGGSDFIAFGMDTYALQGSVVKTMSTVTLKAGAEMRLIRFNAQQLGDNSILFNFTPAFTQGPNPAASSSTAGIALASFLLGTPNDANVTPAPALAMQTNYYAAFVQADWKVTPKLTLNLGLRYDYETPRTDRFNQLTNFDFNATPAIDVTGLNLKGALSFVGVNGVSRFQSNPDRNNLAPRVGFAWKVADKTVIRGGIGLFYGTMMGVGGAGVNYGVSGFAAATNMVTSLDGVTPYRYLSNPYPEGLVAATGSKLGTATLLGQTLNMTDRGNYVPYSAQWNFDIQRELPLGVLFDIGYAGNRGIGFQQDRSINTLPDSALSLGSALRTQVANPFYGKITSGILAQKTVSQAQLLRPYPQFDTITSVNNSWANSRYHALQVKVEKRYAKGLTILGAYTFSKLMDYGIGPFAGEAVGGASFQDWNNLAAEWGASTTDQTHRLLMNAVYELPFFKGSKGVVNQAFGGWQVGAIASFLSGGPLGMNAAVNNTFSQGGGQRPNWNGVNPALSNPTVDNWFDTNVFSSAPAYTYGTAPRTFNGVRSAGAANLDMTISKTFQIYEKLRLQFRGEAFNVSNTPRFAPPNQAFGNALFGKVTSQQNQPRVVQFGLKLLF